MLRGIKYIALVAMVGWVVMNLFSRERRKNIDAGFQRAGIVISLMFVGAGIVMLYRAIAGPNGESAQALMMIIIGLGMIAYQRWGQ